MGPDKEIRQDTRTAATPRTVKLESLPGQKQRLTRDRRHVHLRGSNRGLYFLTRKNPTDSSA